MFTTLNRAAGIETDVGAGAAAPAQYAMSDEDDGARTRVLIRRPAVDAGRVP